MRVYKPVTRSKLALIMTQPTLWLSQLQFFSSLGFVLLFLALELGLVWLLLYFRLRSLGSGPSAWLAAYRFWVRIFALASILSFSCTVPVLVQLGSLWPGLTERAGNVVGPMVAGALLTAFVFKSCFLGAMLFGQRRFSGWAHALTIFMVALGVTLVTLWLVALISWMHTPAGASFIDGRYTVYRWQEVIFNPAFGWYAAVLISASVLTAVFLVMGIVAWQALHHPVETHQRMAFFMALRTACVVVLILGATALGSATMVAKHQPARAAATLAYWHSDRVPDLVVFGWPDLASGTTRQEVALRGAGTPFVGKDTVGNYRALDQFSGMMPPVALVFWSFRVALIVACVMALLAWLTLWRARHLVDPTGLGRAWLRVLVAATFSGWVLLAAGFLYLFAGAFPFAINGTVTVSELLGKAAFTQVFSASVAYWVVYTLMILGFLHMLWHTARHGVVPVVRIRGRA